MANRILIKRSLPILHKNRFQARKSGFLAIKKVKNFYFCFKFATKPFEGSNQFYFNPQVGGGYPMDSAGFAGYFVFAAPGNTMQTLGWDT
ncbi:MAG: hypothetical protein IKX88_12325, partial [Thermoguttaceae bacterium]|nr:hypothetical protein [Thermoguttaceae bacterium]